MDRPPGDLPDFDRLTRPAAVALWSAVAVVVAVVLWRKLAGALTAQPSSLAACAGVAAAAAAGLAAMSLDGLSGRYRGRWDLLLTVAATLVPPVILAAMLAPRHSVPTMAGLTVLLLATAGGIALRAASFDWPAEREGKAPAEPQQSLNAENSSGSAGASPSLTLGEASPSLTLCEGERPDHNFRVPSGEADVVQWMTRTVAPDGQELLEGAVKIHFEAGQKQAAVHLAFCPAFAGPPEIECEPLDESDVRLKVGAVYAYGARVEVRRTETAAATCEIGFTAAAAAVGADAA